MHFSAFSLLPFLALADVALSICPGFNYGIGNVNAGDEYNMWNVYDDSCKVVDGLGLLTKDNPCFAQNGIFGCSPPPVYFNRYKSTHTGLIYTCRPDGGSGSCGSDIISVCCRNDGH
ncbi:hypothetical protein BDN72DRAFT_898236 [Pluteus cervinus]|uniref:Uncharacterized protein n=1 Tax=Pluteus cervinus TaxID=181527 RepID=A0ACD3AQR8_9AGAR|nr:hypothetical protein BDN72DRAFT_898236 [Pluteus cervinus]